MLVCVIPLAPGPSIAKQTKVLEENVIGKYTNLFGASNPHCRLIYRQWGMFVTNVEQGKNNTFTFPIAFKNNLYFYWAFDYTGYFYNLIIKNKDINSCYIYGAYPNGTEQTGELAPTGVSGISVFIGS